MHLPNPSPAATAAAAQPQDLQQLQAALALAQQEAAYWHAQYEALLLACVDKTEGLDALLSRLQAEPTPRLQ